MPEYDVLKATAAEASSKLWGGEQSTKVSPHSVERFLAERAPLDTVPLNFYGFYGFYGVNPVNLVECEVVSLKFTLYNYGAKDLTRVNTIRYIIDKTKEAVEQTYLQAVPAGGEAKDLEITVTELDGSAVTYITVTVEVYFKDRVKGGAFGSFIGVTESDLSSGEKLELSDKESVARVGVDIIVQGYLADLAEFTSTLQAAFQSAILYGIQDEKAAESATIEIIGAVHPSDVNELAVRVVVLFADHKSAAKKFEQKLASDPYGFGNKWGPLEQKIKVVNLVDLNSKTFTDVQGDKFDVPGRKLLSNENENNLSKQISVVGLGHNSIDTGSLKCQLDCDDCGEGSSSGSGGTSSGLGDSSSGSGQTSSGSGDPSSGTPETEIPSTGTFDFEFCTDIRELDRSDFDKDTQFDAVECLIERLDIDSSPEVTITAVESLNGGTRVHTSVDFSSDESGSRKLYKALEDDASESIDACFDKYPSPVSIGCLDIQVQQQSSSGDGFYGIYGVQSSFYGFYGFYGSSPSTTSSSMDFYGYKSTSPATSSSESFSEAAKVYQGDGANIIPFSGTKPWTPNNKWTPKWQPGNNNPPFQGSNKAPGVSVPGVSGPGKFTEKDKTTDKTTDKDKDALVIPVYFTTILTDYNMEDLYTEEDMAQFRSDYIGAVEAAIKLLGITSGPTVTIQDVLPGSVAVPTVVTFYDDPQGAQLFMEVLKSNPSLAFPAFSGMGPITIVEVSPEAPEVPDNQSTPKQPEDRPTTVINFPASDSEEEIEMCPSSRSGESCCGPATLDAQNDCCWKGVDECGVCGGSSDTCATTATVRVLVSRPGVTSDVNSPEFAGMIDDFKAGMANLFNAFGIKPANIVVDTASVTSQRTAAGLEFDIPFRINPDTDNTVSAPTLTKARAILVAAAEQKTEADGMTIVAVLDVARAGVCGNNHCEIGEFIGHEAHSSASECPVDCPSYNSCPAKNGKECGGNGICSTDSGTCKCKTGYVGDDCAACAAGFHVQDGLCVAHSTAVRSTDETPTKSNATDIILGVVFGVVALVLVGLFCYYVFVIRKRNEASRDEGLAFSSQQQVPASNEEPDIPTRQLTENTV